MEGIAKKLLIWLLLLAAMVLVIPSLRHPAHYFDSIVGSLRALGDPNAPDPLYEQRIDAESKGLIREIRDGPDYFFVHPFDGSEELVTEMAFPKLPVSAPGHGPDTATYQIMGPHIAPAPRTENPRMIERWIRMIIALLCWVGVSAVFKAMSYPVRIFLGLFLCGWGLLALSLVLGVGTGKLVLLLTPPLLLLGMAQTYRSIRSKELVLSGVFLMAMLMLPMIWSPFFFGDLSGPDARVMWFYRYKFEFTHGFNPYMIANYMGKFAQRDYPWFLGGPLSFASAFGTWNENAAYGSLFWIVAATVALFLRFTSMLRPFERVALVAIGYGGCAHYVTNGYMDGLWIPVFGLFLFGYHVSRKRMLDDFDDRGLFILLAVACSLKNEAIVCLCVFALGNVVYRYAYQRESTARFIFGSLTFFGLAALPSLFQKKFLEYWNIFDQYSERKLLAMTAYDYLKRFESAHRFLFKKILFERGEYSIPLLLMLLVGALVSKRGEKLLLGIYGYIFPIMLVYTFTPYDQDWQMQTSAYRVLMIIPFFAVLATGFMMVRDEGTSERL